MTTETDNTPNELDNFKENDPQIDPTEKGMKSLRERIRQVKTTRWIRFGVVSLLFFLWVVWMGTPWLAIFWLLLLDIYITGYIPWSWWKNKNGAVRDVMAWLDAMIYALVLVYFIFTFIGQNYKIPSSSLEKSLLVGDYLWVNKAVYGPRVPQTPLHFPLAQHTVPFLNLKSYSDNPKLEYHRLPGMREISRGDIVVFNYPQGDTVATKYDNKADFYQLKYELEICGVQDPVKYMYEHPDFFGEIVYRPVDRRENYVKRCLGLPGDRLAIKGDTVFINGEPIADPDNVQFNYIIPVSGKISRDKWLSIGVREDDSGFEPNGPELTGYKFYNVPLTAEMKKVVESWPEVNGPLIREGVAGIYDTSQYIFPIGSGFDWKRQDMGELWIPKRGSTLHLTLNNLPIYERAISVYEGNDLKVEDGKIYINGEQTDYYTFKMDYYWMMGDNRDRSADSRYWGFVPEDHIVGSPVFVIVSLDEERGLFDGKIRWNRIFKDANPDDKW